MITAGSDILIYMPNAYGELVAVCHSRTCTLSANRDMKETSGPSGYSRRYIPSYVGYTVSSNGLYVLSDAINLVSVLEWLQGGNRVPFKFQAQGDGGVIYSGSMFINTWELTAENAQVALYEFNAVVDGAVSVIKKDYIKSVHLASLAGVRLPGCPNPYPVAVLWYDGTVIGIANDADDVAMLFNNYPQNKFYTLVGITGGCDFTMRIKFNSPDRPSWVPATPGAGLAIGENGQDGRVIGENGGNVNVIGVAP